LSIHSLFLFVGGMFSETIPLAALGWIVPFSSFSDVLRFALGFSRREYPVTRDLQCL
jgi:hypothetical protein